MIQPLTEEHTSPDDLFSTFSQRAISASEDLLAFTQLWQSNRHLIEHAAMSRAASKEGIRRWGLKDGMPPGVLQTTAAEEEDAKEREERQRKVEREARERERKRRKNTTDAVGRLNGEDVVMMEGGGDDAVEEEVGEAEEATVEDDESKKREEAERLEEGNDPKLVVEEFIHRLKNPLEGDIFAGGKWGTIKFDYIDASTPTTGSNIINTVQSPQQAGVVSGVECWPAPSSTTPTSATAYIKITLPPPTHLLFIIEVTPLPPPPPAATAAIQGPACIPTTIITTTNTTSSTTIDKHRFTIPTLISTLGPSPNSGSSSFTSPSHPYYPSYSSPSPSQSPLTPHLYTSILRAVAARPRHEQANLRLLLEMVCQYVNIYTEKCVGCGRLTFAGGGARAELPVVRRRAKERNRAMGNGDESDGSGSGNSSGNGNGNGNGRKTKAQVKMNINAKDALDTGVGVCIAAASDVGEVYSHRTGGGSPTSGDRAGEGGGGRLVWRAWHEGCLEQAVTGLTTTAASGS